MIHRQRVHRPSPPVGKPPAPSPVESDPIPCAVCDHVPGDPLPPGMILRNARLSNPEVRDLKVDEFLHLATSERSLSWYHDLENGRKTIPEWTEWHALCKAAGIDPAKAAAGSVAPWIGNVIALGGAQ